MSDNSTEGPVEDIVPEWVDLPCISKMHQSFSFPSFKRNNFHFVEDDKLVCVVGNTLHFIDMTTADGKNPATFNWFLNEEGTLDGIGAVCVHPSREYIAVGEIQATKPNQTPNVYIYHYPSMEIVKTLRSGTKRGFTAMAFNATGEQLATVGGDPDYMLTIWNWNEEKTLLRYKAFGQDVYNVSFSNNIEGVLTTSGMGHIKFWKMSKTFTGLKLKGDIGKFGKVDMSDINGYFEFPDGKVLSGSEQGNLILWEGNLVKVLITGEEGRPCHAGAINFVSAIDNEIVTAGVDGFIRYWSLETIDLLEASDTDISLPIKPIQEYQITRGDAANSPANIVTLVRRGKDNVWIVQDGKGTLWKLEISPRSASSERSHKITRLLDFNAGAITCVVTAPNQHVSASGSEDGSIRIVNHHTGQSLFSRKFNAKVVKLLWNPEYVDASQTSLTCGFDDGVIRYLVQGETQWRLMHAFKPHSTSVVSFDYSRDGKTFVSASRDELFFFRASSFEPVGFTSIKSTLNTTINDMKIHDEAIVLGLQDGRVVKVGIPNLDKIDNSKTYEFEWKDITSYNLYQWLKPQPKKEEDGDMDDDSEKEEEEEVTPDPPKVPVRSVVFAPDGNMLVAFEKIGGLFRYSGNCWESPYHTELEYPFNCLNSFEKAFISHLQFSSDGNYLIITYNNGKIRLVDSSTIGTSNPVYYSAYDLHSFLDSTRTSAVTSFDDSYIISVGSDGGFFVQKLNNREPRDGVEPLLSDAEDTVTDIISADHWSIEEARIKNAEMEKEKASLERKSKRMERLQQLKQEYSQFVKSIDSRESIGLNREDLQIDARLQETLAKRLEEKLDLARKELAWDKAKTDLRLQKVKNEFFDSLDAERVVLKAFRSGKVVTTFRTRKLHQELLGKIEEVHRLINEEMERKRRMDSDRMEQEFLELQRQQERHQMQMQFDQTPTEIHQLSMKGTKSLTATRRKAEDIERQREERLNARRDLERRKPSSEDDPRQLAEIKHAEENMGDFKLKTDPNYVVPENQRMTTEKKLRQMILLEESVHTLRMVFNQNLFHLKEVKAKLIEKFLVYSSRIDQINGELRVKEPIVEPRFDPSEIPEMRYHVTPEELEAYKKQKDLEERKKQAAESGKFLSSDETEVEKSGPASTHSFQSKRSSHAKSVKGKDPSKERILQSIPVSEMEKMEEEVKRHTLLYEKDRLLRRMKAQVDSFDMKVEELRREKFKLEADLKNSELRLILLYKELELLKDFEKKDSDNYSQLEAKRNERDEIVAKIQNCQERLAEKKEEIAELVQEQKLGNEFLELVPENHPAHQQLFQVYKKSKKNKKQDSDSESDSESDDSDSEYDEDEDDEQIDEKKPENIDCSETLWFQVIALRNKRIEQEKNLDNIARSVELLKKEREGLVKQQKVVNHALKKIEEQIKSVQKEKQHKLNELTTVVVLKFNQIQGLLQSKIPLDLTDYVVFTNGGLNRLGARIAELKKENKHLHHKIILHQRRVSHLQKEQKQREDVLQECIKNVNEVQHLKFGQLVDLEALENASVDTKAEELKELLSAEEQRTEQLLKAWDKKINDEKDKLTHVTKENTRLLQTLSTYREKQQTLETELDESRKGMVNRVTKSMTVTSNTRETLKEQVISQAREIEIAKNEIAILRSKHSHVYRVNNTQM